MSIFPKMQEVKKFFFLCTDDDTDDRYFFEKTLKNIFPENRLSFAEDGEKLMNFLSSNSSDLPDVLFLDLNMPRKNGTECLAEIKSNAAYKNIPVIIYSTSSPESNADHLYNNGAHYYVRKADMIALDKVLRFVLTGLNGDNFNRPSRKDFVLKAS
jgi:CheY-like chemotaxis protein